MKKVIALFLSFIFLLIQTPVSSAAGVFLAYEWTKDGLSVKIEFNNLSRDTFIGYGENQQPVFLNNDRVHYKVTSSLDPNSKLLASAKESFISGRQDIRLDYIQGVTSFEIMSGTKQGAKVYQTYFDTKDGKFPIKISEGEFLIDANREITLIRFGYYFESMIYQNERLLNNGPAYFQENIVSKSISSPIYLYKFKEKLTQSIDPLKVGNLSIKNGSFELPLQSSSGLPVQIASLSPATCKIESEFVILGKVGLCKIVVTQAGDETFQPAKRLIISFKIVKGTTKPILCSNGESLIEVSGKNAKCPAEYLQF